MLTIVSRLTVIGTLVVALSSCSTSSMPVATTTPEPTASIAPEWLFVVQSTGASTFNAQTNALAIPTDAVLSFTDRPLRETGMLRPSDFIELWSSTAADSFTVDPPNAALTYWSGEGSTAVPRTLACEIVGGVDYSNASGLLSMTIRPIGSRWSELPAVLENASLFIDDVSSCVNSNDDEIIVEYFNELVFENNLAIKIGMTPAGDKHSVTMSCPERETSTFPPPDMDIRISTLDGTQRSSCYDGGEIQILPADIPTLSYCAADGQCEFVVSVVNKVTQTVYSATRLLIPLDDPGVEYPDLTMATIPICPNGQ